MVCVMYVMNKEMYKGMKWIIIILFSLIPIIVKGQIVSSQNEDTLTQSIYYQYTIINTKRWNVYGYSQYDLNWGDENGISINFKIPYKRSKRNKPYKRK